MLLPIDVLNSSSKAQFKQTIDVLFEAAPPLVDRLYSARPFASYEHVINAAATLIADMPESEQLTVVNAHPRIGAPKTNLSQLSRAEQGADKDEHILQQLAQLNAQYESKFGFKFIVFVNGRPKRDLIPVIQQRLNNERSAELQTGIDAMLLIARDRLKKLANHL